MAVFEHSSYKEFLNEFMVKQPKAGRGEVNRMAEAMDVHPSLVSQVLRGDKDLSVEQAYKLAGYLGLINNERDYFLLLIQQERAGSKDLKQYFKSKSEELKIQSQNISTRVTKHRRLTDFERSVFYSSWIYSAVRMFASLGEGQPIETIAERFAMPREEVARILAFLKDARLIEEDGGLFRMISAQTHLEFGSPFLTRHHTNWRLKAIQRSETLKKDELMFTSPMSISKKDFARVREQIADLIKTTAAVIKDSPADEIACFNIDLFWM